MWSHWHILGFTLLKSDQILGWPSIWKLDDCILDMLPFLLNFLSAVFSLIFVMWMFLSAKAFFLVPLLCVIQMTHLFDFTDGHSLLTPHEKEQEQRGKKLVSKTAFEGVHLVNAVCAVLDINTHNCCKLKFKIKDTLVFQRLLKLPHGLKQQSSLFIKY